MRGKPDWEQILASLGTLYAQGAKIDWQGFDAGYGRSKTAALPTYAFEGRRYWIAMAPETAGREPADSAGPQCTAPAPAPRTGNLLYSLAWQPQPLPSQASAKPLPDPGAVIERITPLADSEIRAFSDLLAQMEALCATYVQDALVGLGWNFAVGSRFSTADAAAALQVADKHQPLLGRLLGMLAEEGILCHSGQLWQAAAACRRDHAAERWQRLREGYPRAAAELTLLGRCGAGLAGVLRGACDPLGLVFPEGDLSTAARLYEDSPTFGAMNRLMGEAVAAIVANTADGRKLRILEIGAGTGGTTAAVLPHLSAERAEYIFSDVSAHFLTQAKARFADYPFVRYQRLDIEKDPLQQGIAPRSVDVILAANVLHATADLRHTLRQVERLLAPGGLLVLLEGIAQRRWLDMIFGLLDGWWRFQDHDLRPAHPLLGTTAWEALLCDSGFERSAVLAPGQGAALFDQAVIVARAMSLAQQPAPTATTVRHWLVCADGGGIGGELAALLRGRGDLVTTALQGAGFARTADDAFTVDAQQPDDLRRLLQAVYADGPPLHGVLHLWGLDAPAPDDNAASAVDPCMGLLHLTQALVARNAASPPALWPVTRRAVSVDGTQDLLSGLCQAPLQGLAQVIATEHPELRCAWIDIDGAPGSAAALNEEITHGPQSDCIALRGGARFAARLLPLAAAAPDQPAGMIRADGAYLISGGLGGIGLRIAALLAEQGAGRIVLLSRSGKPTAGSAAAEAMGKLKQAGADGVILRADVSQKADVQSVLKILAASGMPLRGIVHAAGVFEDRLLTAHTRASFASVFAAKVAGAWHLHALTRELPLDFFVLCSSATSLACSAGLGNYVAANTFLDALAHYRRSLGLPGLSIGWGPWRATGMADAVGQQRTAQWAAQGFGQLAPDEALAAFQHLLGAKAAQVAVLRMDWPRFFAQQADHARPAFFERLGRLDPVTRPAPRDDFKHRLQAAPADQQPELLREHLRALVATVLGLPAAAAVDPCQGFFQMGMDSLTSMELRNRLQQTFSCTLAATLIFKYPTVVSLTDYLLQAVMHPGAAAAPAAATPAPAEGVGGAALQMDPAAISQLSEAEAEALLLERLENLRY